MKNHRLLSSLYCLLLCFHLHATPSDSLVALYPEPDYAFVLETAAFPGGLDTLTALIAEAIPVPDPFDNTDNPEVLEISFAVGSDGQLFDIRVETGLGKTCDEKVVDLMRSLPRWHPARFGEDPICMRMRLLVAVNFSE